MQFAIMQVKQFLNNFVANPDQECGIPVRKWLMTFFEIFAVRAMIQLAKICFLQHNFSQR